MKRLKSGVPAPVPQKKQRALSRPFRLQALLSEAEALRDGYNSWMEALPENLQEDMEKLEEMLHGIFDQYYIEAWQEGFYDGLRFSQLGERES